MLDTIFFCPGKEKYGLNPKKKSSIKLFKTFNNVIQLPCFYKIQSNIVHACTTDMNYTSNFFP